MAQVPEAATLPSAQANPAAPARINAPSLPDSTVAGVLGQAAEGYAKSADQFADVFQKHAMELAGLNNKAMADTANTHYLDQAGQLQADFEEKTKNVDPATASTMYADHVRQLEQLRQDARQGVTNPMAQSIFDQDSRLWQGRMMMSASKNVATGVSAYRTAAYEGQVANYTNDISQNPFDDKRVEFDHQAIANAAFSHYAVDLGLPKETVQAAITKDISEANMSVIDEQVKSNAPGALGYLNKHWAEFTPEARSRATEAVSVGMMTHTTDAIANGVMMGAAGKAAANPGSPVAAAVTPGAGLTAPMASVESSIVAQFPGTRVTSGRRTPGENAAAGGVVNSAHETGNAVDFHVPKGVSGAAMAAQIQATHPGVTAIYEGPGAAHSTAPHVHVQMNGGSVSSNTGDRLESLQQSAPDLFAQADAQAEAAAKQYTVNGQPIMDADILKQNVEQKLRGEFERQDFIYKQAIAPSMSRLTDVMDTGGPGGEPISDKATLFKSYPQAQQDYLNLDATGRHHVDALIQSGSNRLTDGRLAEWDHITGLTAQQQLALNPLDPNLDLTHGQRNRLITYQKDLRASAAKQQDHDGKITSITNNKLVRQALTEAEITDDKGNSIDDVRYSQFLGRMLQKETEYFAANPKAKTMPDQDVYNAALGLTAKRGGTELNLMNPSTWFAQRAEMPPLVPAERVPGLTSDLANRLGHPPSQEQVAAYYEARKNRGLEK